MKKRPIILAALLAMATTGLFADKLPFQGPGWARIDASVAGWNESSLATVEAKLRHLRPTALVIAQDGRTVAEWGDSARKVNVYSIRKSLLSALFGIAAAEGQVDLDRTLADLAIDDKEPRLTPAEKEATIRDLLMSKSGIYHVAAYEFGGIASQRPARGSHPHGTYWYYNNFDFNVLGTIYSKLLKQGVFTSVEQRLAKPLGMQDFSADTGSSSTTPDPSTLPT